MSTEQVADEILPGSSEADEPLLDTDQRTRLVRLAQGRFGDFWIVGVLAVLVIIFGIFGQGFLSQQGWIATSEFAVITMLLAIGQTIVIVTGGIDLSDGAVLGCTSMGAAWLMGKMLGSHDSQALVVICGLSFTVLLGACAGAINGLLITKARLTPFIATLATLSVFEGAQSLISNGTDLTNFPNWMGTVGTETILGGWLPLLVLATAVFALAGGWLLHRSRFGLRSFAIGSNRDAAERAGIRVDRHLIWVYVLSGVLAAVAGWCYLARFTDASPVAGSGDELQAIAAVVIGGASLMGGKGSMLGTVVGVLIISVLVTGLITMNVPTFWQEVAVGAILAGAVYADQIRGRLALR